VTVQGSNKIVDVSYLSDKSSSAENTKDEKLNMEEITYPHKKYIAMRMENILKQLLVLGYG
jgi:hypothetical protein